MIAKSDGLIILFYNTPIKHKMIISNKSPKFQSYELTKAIQHWYSFNQSVKIPMKKSIMKQRFNQFIYQYQLKNLEEIIFNKINNINNQAIIQQFSAMMQNIFTSIQPQLSQCYQSQSLAQIYSNVQFNLNKGVFPKDFRLKNKIKQSNHTKSKIGKSIQMKSQLSSLLFFDLLELMSILLKQFSDHYQLQSIDDISTAISDSMLIFSDQHQHSKIIEMDEASLVQEQDQTFNSFIGQLFQEVFTGQSQNQNQQFKSNKSNSETYKKSSPKLKRRFLNWVGNFTDKISGKANHYLQFFSHNCSSKDDKFSKPQIIEPQVIEPMIKSLISSKIKSKHSKLTNLQIEFIENLANLKMQQIAQKYLKNSFKLELAKIVDEVCFQDNSQFIDLKEAVMCEFKSLVIYCLKDQDESKIGGNKNEFKQYFEDNELGIVCMVLVYKSISRNYDGHRRRILKRIYKSIQKKLNLNLPTFKVLLYLQNYNIQQSHPLRQQLVEQSNPQNGDCLSGKYLQIQLKKIQVHQFNRMHKISKFYLQRLSKRSLKTKVVNFLISGFLSQDTDKLEEWRPFVEEMQGNQIYALKWASKSSGELVDYILNSIKDLTINNGAFKIVGGPYIRAAALIHQIYEKYQENPFQPALDQAQITGYFLAELIISTFSDSLINLTGFSLGTEVILSTLKRLQSRGKLHLVNKIILMGGAVDQKNFMQTIHSSQYPLDIINLYCQNDSVLKYLLKICKPFANPIGLTTLQVNKGDEDINLYQKIKIMSHNIRNEDCTDFVNGHLDYRQKLKFIAGIIDLKNEI